ncbi:MAG: PBS lyase, partial [Deltaproteobacteria bacterium]
MNDVLAALQSADEETRYQAVRAAQALPAERRLQVGQQALGDEAWRVRKAATELLLAHPDREAVLEIFVARLGDEANAGARNAAAEALTALGAEAVDALHAVARSRDVDQRKFAADILGEGGAPAAVEPLVALLDDADVNVRAAAAEALGKVGDDRARAALLERVASEDLLVRLSALEGLVRLGAVVPLERLSPLLSERLLRRPVLRLLARVETPAALDHLLEAVSDPSPGTREIALASIGTWVQRTGDETALRESLAHRDPTPILRAARAALSGEASAVYGA